MGSHLGEIHHAYFGKDIRHLIKGRGGQVISDLHRKWTQDM